jgi:uncharacterized protein (TIGR02145 family)
MKPITFFLGFALLFATISCEKNDENPGGNNQSELTDIEGNNYKTVKIGNQVWMAENLKVTKFRNGDPIPNIEIGTEWVAAPFAYCTYENDPANLETYGCLYHWGAVADPRGLAPEGWHIPTVSEFSELEQALGQDAACKLGTWGCGTNESGFNALPAGFREWGQFRGMDLEAYWWTSSRDAGEDPALYFLINTSSRFDVANGSTGFGLSVRCVKD